MYRGPTVRNRTVPSRGTTSISTDVSNNLFVSPVIGKLYADASGLVGTLQQVTVTINDIDRIFTADLTDAQAVAILNSFEITDVSAGPSPAPTSQFAEVNVTMKQDNSGNFISALMNILEADNTVIYDASDNSLSEYLASETAKSTIELLNNDGIINLLEASELLDDFTIALDASGGAKDMWNKMSTDNNKMDYESPWATFRKAIFAQIPEVVVESYFDLSSNGTSILHEDISGLKFLPLRRGDTLAVVFDVEVGKYDWANGLMLGGPTLGTINNDAYPVFGSNYNVGGIFGNYNSAAAASGYATSGGLEINQPVKRRVAIKLKMNSGGTNFTLNTTQLTSESILIPS